MALIKHLGKIGEKPCVILYREVPGEPENCLVIQPSGMSDIKQDELMSVVQGETAQTAHELSEVLKRNNFSDGTIMLDELHYTRQIKKVGINLVTINYGTGADETMPMTALMEAIRKKEGGDVPPITDETHLTSDQFKQPESTGATVETDPTLSANATDARNKETVDPATPEEVARSLLTQANLLAGDAKVMYQEASAKKAEAIKLDPSLAESS